MEINALAKQVKKFCDDRNWDQFHGPKDLAIGLSTEACELLEIFRFKSDQECLDIFSNPGEKRKVEDEMADVFFFLLRMADRHEIHLETALKNKMVKNEEKYPVEKARGVNKKYTGL